MDANHGAPSGETLMEMILASKDIAALFSQHPDWFAPPPFHVYLNRLCDRRGQVPEQAILDAAIHRTYGHQIFNGLRRPSRDKVLQLAFGMRLDIEAAQALLCAARVAALCPAVKRDAALLYALQKRLTVLDAQDLLNRLGLALLGSAEKDA